MEVLDELNQVTNSDIFDQDAAGGKRAEYPRRGARRSSGAASDGPRRDRHCRRRTPTNRGEEETTTQRQASATVASTEKSEGKTPTCSGRGAICHVTAPPGFYAASPWGGYARDKGGDTGARSARRRTKVIGRAS